MKRVELCPSSCRSNVSRTFKNHWFTRESWDGSVGNLFNDTTTCSSFDFNAVNREQKSVSVGLLSAPLTQKSSRFEWAIIRTQFDDSLLVKMKDKRMSSPGARWLFLSGHQIVRMHSGEADKRRLRFSLLILEPLWVSPSPALHYSSEAPLFQKCANSVHKNVIPRKKPISQESESSSP